MVVSRGGVATASPSVSVVVQYSPIMIAQPRVLTSALPGATIQLLCGWDATPTATATWYLNGQALQHASGPTLVLRNVSAAAAGTYTAVVTNALGSVTTDGAAVVVLAPPSITTPLRNTSWVPGARASLMVGVSGQPYPALQWMLNGINITGATGTELLIPSITPDMEGWVAVLAVNALGAASQSAYLHVYTAPSIAASLPSALVLNPGQPATLAITATGDPAPAVHWTVRDGIETLPAFTLLHQSRL